MTPFFTLLKRFIFVKLYARTTCNKELPKDRFVNHREVEVR